jgi:mercuric ion transport protein
MNTATTHNTTRRSPVLGYFSLFTSVSTLLCCALPSLLVLLGLGASVASMLAFAPWLVFLSHHKVWTFSISGALIGLSFINSYYFVPRLKGRAVCVVDGGTACEDTSRVSKVLLWISVGIYTIGFFVAYALGPILTRLDQ